MVACTATFAYIAARGIGFAGPILVLLLSLFFTAVLVGAFFLKDPVSKRGRIVEVMAGVWSLLMYLSLGFVPLILRQWGSA
jgi:4-hydroxybenzoate polyprenyltransferase